MTVYQVEKFYILIEDVKITEEQQIKIEELLQHNGIDCYTFLIDDKILYLDTCGITVNGLESKDEADHISQSIEEIIS